MESSDLVVLLHLFAFVPLFTLALITIGEILEHRAVKKSDQQAKVVKQ